jgi:hypothetical protein
VEIPKNAVIDFLRERGQSDKAEQAQRELPDQVDPERDSSMLDRFGIDQQDLVQELGDRLPGGVGDRLGL